MKKLGFRKIEVKGGAIFFCVKKIAFSKKLAAFEFTHSVFSLLLNGSLSFKSKPIIRIN